MAYVNKVRKGQIDENEAARRAAEEAAEENRYEFFMLAEALKTSSQRTET